MVSGWVNSEAELVAYAEICHGEGFGFFSLRMPKARSIWGVRKHATPRRLKRITLNNKRFQHVLSKCLHEIFYLVK